MGKNKSYGDKLFITIVYVLMGLISLVCLYPMWHVIMASFSDPIELMRHTGVILKPMGYSVEGYRVVLQNPNIPRSYMNTIFYVVLGTSVNMILTTFGAYALSRKGYMGKRILTLLIVFTMYFNAGLIPMFLTMQNLHLTNSFWVYVIPVIVQPFNIILVKTYMESIPRSLQEAAEIDGAGIMKVFLKIILPTSTPILATIAIFAAVAQWNSFQDTLIYVTDQKLYSLQYILYQYINQANSLATMVKNSSGGTNLNMAALATQQTPTSIRMTVSVIVVMPILFIYPMFQRYFVKGIMIGAVKG